MNELPFAYEGPDALREPVLTALRDVVDPEVALNIVDIGLVYGVAVGEHEACVRMTMTSPACPVTDLIVDEVEAGLAHVLPPGVAVAVELVWAPPWSPERLSDAARRFMGW